MDIAIITGASSGLGRVFAEKVVERYADLDEIWVMARREDKLKELAETYKDTNFRILAMDLSQRESFVRLENLLADIKPTIKLLINNAGVDGTGPFRKMEAKRIYSILDVNVTGMTMVSRVCLPYMNRGSYQIIVGSEGSYLPLPIRTVYGASKIYGRFFARALRQEEKQRGVNILYMGTGAMNTDMFKANAFAEEVASVKFLDLNKITVTTMKRAEKGKGIYSSGFHNKLTRVAGKLFPSAISVKFSNLSKFVPKE